jgi:hypothetical protein
MKCFVCNRQFKDEEVMGVDFYMFTKKKSFKESEAVCIECIKEVGAKKIQEARKDL